ncbi:MAG: hypothetical protein UHH95_00710 [Oscillospiraceae bacterium]|nr:hypothetical protein [Oscillospiraceae bacterium]
MSKEIDEILKPQTDIFIVENIPDDAKKKEIDIDLNKLYERADHELGLQQSKRDQIITIYLAIFSFLIPFALSMEILSWQVKGLIFLATAIVGILFANIIIRYRVYKEAYWLCCQTITVLFGIKQEYLKKSIIQQCYRETIYKKGKKYLIDKKTREIDQNGKEKTIKKFSKAGYVKDNIFSSETIYFFIHSFITALIFGLSIGLILMFSLIVNIIIATVCSIALFIVLSAKYFTECIKIYGVLIDETHKSFNFAFSKAWFLHFYMD